MWICVKNLRNGKRGREKNFQKSDKTFPPFLPLGWKHSNVAVWYRRIYTTAMCTQLEKGGGKKSSSSSSPRVYQRDFPSPDTWKENFLLATALVVSNERHPRRTAHFPSSLLLRYYLKCTSNYFNSLEYDFLHYCKNSSERQFFIGIFFVNIHRWF